jgi:uncharacterized membrane protein
LELLFSSWSSLLSLGDEERNFNVSDRSSSLKPPAGESSLIELSDAAIAVKQPNGTVKLNQRIKLAPRSARLQARSAGR